jgi:hypothetical protein
MKSKTRGRLNTWLLADDCGLPGRNVSVICVDNARDGQRGCDNDDFVGEFEG